MDAGKGRREMKRVLGFLILVLATAVPAHAQFLGTSIGSGSSVGAVSFPPLRSYPPTVFAVVAVSGTNGEFVPSGFVPYESAVAAGRAVLDGKAKSVVEVAQENAGTAKTKARLAMIRNANGAVVIVSP